MQSEGKGDAIESCKFNIHLTHLIENLRFSMHDHIYHHDEIMVIGTIVDIIFDDLNYEGKMMVTIIMLMMMPTVVKDPEHGKNRTVNLTAVR